MTVKKNWLALGFILFGCSKPGTDIKFQQYYNQGRALYEQHCANCHQTDGTGLGKLIPPLNNDFAQKNISLSICSIRNGLTGPISVNGIVYDHKMPGNTRLTSLEIAEIMTYITNSWNGQASPTTVAEVDSVLLSCH